MKSFVNEDELGATAALSWIIEGAGMNGSRNKAALKKKQTEAEPGSETNHRDRVKTGGERGGMLKKLKSRRSQTAEKWPVVTEDELRAMGGDISPDHVLGLRAVTEGRIQEGGLGFESTQGGKMTPLIISSGLRT